jgi:GNAT superfamily N-acetyltransferase
MQAEIRESRAADWPAVAAVLAELGRPDARGTSGEDRHRAIYMAYLERHDVDAFVAATGDEVLGFVNVEYRPRLNYESTQAWIPELVVKEGARGTGIGKRLLDRAVEAARERGCWSIALESATWRTDAHRFYEREGWDFQAKAFIKGL